MPGSQAMMIKEARHVDSPLCHPACPCVNKADCGIVVHRSWEGAMDDNKVKIMVRSHFLMTHSHGGTTAAIAY